MSYARKLVGRDPVPEITIDTAQGAASAIAVGLIGCIVDAIQSNSSIGADQQVNGCIPTNVQTVLKNRRFKRKNPVPNCDVVGTTTSYPEYLSQVLSLRLLHIFQLP